MPAWNRETAREAGLKGGKARKAYTLRGALARKLKARRPDGTRPWDDALAAFVQKLLDGDVRAIELAMQSVDGPQATQRKVEHTIARDLLIRPDGDARGRIIDAAPQAELPPSAPDGNGTAEEPSVR
jgi:hypothetical protein